MTEFFSTPVGITISRRTRTLDPANALDGFAERLDGARGALFSSGIDYPGRYSRWEFGFIDPPLEIVGSRRTLTARALNARGTKLLEILKPAFVDAPEIRIVEDKPRALVIEIAAGESADFAEEERSLQPSLVTPLRRLIAEFAGIGDRTLGLYGAFGYDLLFQFDPIALQRARPEGQKDIHLYVPDRMVVIDRRKEQAFQHDYEFARGDVTTRGARREPYAKLPRAESAALMPDVTSDHTPEGYAALVDAARERMRLGDIFEVVLSRRFFAAYGGTPSSLYRKMVAINPSPYEFLVQFGDEQLIGTSPEMFVRVEGDRVESCPISGTARRGGGAMEDAERLKALINSDKDEVELTMCTDVDRNDKARICRPGTVQLLARRQIETYAGLFHTVDHVEGRLRRSMTGLDAFLSHMWAVTLTGAPKRKAAEIIETLETSPRGWYGGAVGALLLNGDVNTGITIRTVHLAGHRIVYRVGATLVWDSVGAEEDAETRTKATAIFRILGAEAAKPAVAPRAMPGAGRRIVLVDNEDSFVHTLADYFRQTGAEVTTYRHGLPLARLLAARPDLVVHSPGPGRPAEFGLPALVQALAREGVPQFGVCLGLQGMIEAFGGSLAVLPEPRHGKTWAIAHDGTGLFAGIASPAKVGAYHSLTARLEDFPHEALAITARNESGLVMAIRHRRLPIAAVQFHPESILSLGFAVGHAIIGNVVGELTSLRANPAVEPVTA
jgi:anthranilate synthase